MHAPSRTASTLHCSVAVCFLQRDGKWIKSRDENLLLFVLLITIPITFFLLLLLITRSISNNFFLKNIRNQHVSRNFLHPTRVRCFLSLFSPFFVRFSLIVFEKVTWSGQFFIVISNNNKNSLYFVIVINNHNIFLLLLLPAITSASHPW